MRGSEGSSPGRVETESQADRPSVAIERSIADPSLADAAVDAFAQQVGVPAVPGILLDPVYQQLPDGDTVLP
jgi:hypothetical protein